MQRCALIVAIVAALLLPAAAARAATPERLVVSLSNHRVEVTSNFAGEELVLFGTIETAKNAPERAAGYDLVVTVSGPRQTYRTRLKTRVAGIWVNTESREFVDVPSYLAVLSNRPIEQIAAPDVLRRLQIGLDDFILTQHIGPDLADTVHDDPFRLAFVRLKREQELYQQSPKAVTFLTPMVFRAAIPLPADVRTGDYKIDVKLFSAGALLVQTGSALQVIKTGFEQYVAEGAADYGLLYGIATVLMALSIGWIASVMFRRD
jgi:uncharacterized protein (TIGR02186 family)